MALRDQPYLPLYIQDYLTDEKLNACSAATQGVYIKIMCILHKQEEYGTVSLKQKDKQSGQQNSSITYFFALKFAKLLPFDMDTLLPAINELVEEGVLMIDGDKISQKRMVHDFNVSQVRSISGKKGVLYKLNNKQRLKQNSKQNPEYENESDNEVDIDNNKRSAKGKLPPPTLPEVTEYFQIKGYPPELAQKAFEYYQAANWHDMNGNPVRNWKQKMIANWLKPQNKTNGTNHNQQPAPATAGDRIGRVSKRALAELKRTTIDMLKGSHGNSGDMHPDIIPVPG